MAKNPVGAGLSEGRYGKVPRAIGREIEPLMAEYKPGSPRSAEGLMEEVCERENLKNVLECVNSSREGRAVDGRTVLNQFIQQAVLQLLQWPLDPAFSEHSFGFRPRRSAHQAVARAQGYIAQSNRCVVDLDSENFCSSSDDCG